jgi:tetratricopeptide (TPR) repeat protein
MSNNKFYNRFILIALAIFFSNLFLQAQSPSELKKYAEQLFQAGRFFEAAENFERVQAAIPGDVEVLTRLGMCAFQKSQPEEARRLFNYIIDEKKEKTDPEVYFWLARTLHFQRDFGAAIYYYKLFLKNTNDRNDFHFFVVDNIKRCVSGMSLANISSEMLVENLGDGINSQGDDFAPLPSPKYPNRLYFSSAREGNIGGLRDQNGLEKGEKRNYTADMFVAELEGGVWNLPTALSSLLNTARQEQLLDFSENGQILYFFRGFSLFSGEILTDTAAARDEQRVQQTSAMLPFRPEMADGSPCFFRDSFVVFSSRLKGGQGGADLYWSVFSKQKNKWSMARNLGEMVNSGYDETSPFLSKDGRTLYFSSNSTASMGGFDVFSSKFEDAKNAWSLPKNLGLPINSPGDDQFFRLSANGTEAYFSSDRFGGFGGRDLFIVHFKKERIEQIRISKPLIFSQVAPQFAIDELVIPDELLEKDSLIAPIFYENESDLTGPNNLRQIDGFAALARAIPQAKVVVTCHTDDAEPSKFALQAGIKRAEVIGRVLADRGVANARILLQSTGSQYPIAKNVLNAEPNTAGRRLNRRVELTLHLPGEMAPKIRIERPIINRIMSADGAEFFEEMNKGLSYRVQIASTRQILGGDEVMMFGDLLVESSGGSGQYIWSAGLYKTFLSAADLRNELAAQGFQDTRIVAALNGVRLSKDAAKLLVKTYPDLTFWLEKN